MLLLLGVPAVACMIPGVEMTPAEQACCKEMADRCGEMEMDGDSEHGCCAHLQQDGNQSLLINQRIGNDVHSIVSFAVLGSFAITPLTLPVFLSAPLETSPPESPPHRFFILRI
ncbi:MAG TPA: hypothetical protein VNW97_02790 [Candidatus Saccharimonadales bacterium]|nr:hypothetical protein [Candidatus Saccharimonadales bacterium]